MIPRIPQQRQFSSNADKPFNDLIDYIEGEKENQLDNKLEKKEKLQAHVQTSKFTDLLNYATNKTDKNTKAEKCIAIQTHGVRDISTASHEMNAVAAKNKRCKDPAYHFILSWPEHEKPTPEAIFDAANHAIKTLGLSEHQYVIAIHGNTDNMHCHVSVNRVHPITYKSKHLQYPKSDLHQAARESEIKHDWTHDNGIFIVKKNASGKKIVVLNKDYAEAAETIGKHAHPEHAEEKILPTWHDPESLESWLKTKVAKSLKNALPDLDGWHALHAWLDKYSINLTDSGGGGMRLQATSPDTGEQLDIAASKGLRLLKRDKLEKDWGPFESSQPLECTVQDLTHLTPKQLQKGMKDVLNRSPDHGRPPRHIRERNERNAADRAARSADNHVIRDPGRPATHETEEGSRLHELPPGGVDHDERKIARMLLQDEIRNRVGDRQAGQDQSMRRTDTSDSGRSGRSLNRDDAKRQERKDQRAAAREDLRHRFAKYKRFVQSGDTAHYSRLKDLQAIRNQALKEIREKSKAAKAAIPKSKSSEVRLATILEINAESLRQKLQVQLQFDEKGKSLKATRTPPLSWRAWLYEQANFADQAALSALRGIVYQAQRDAKKDEKAKQAGEEEADTAEYREQQYRKVMARLLDEEKKEAAIRSANLYKMRPHEADAVLKSYAGIKWRVTGNGNVEYSALAGDHLFTDRGNRITFDRVKVTDHEIRLALVHAQHKYGKKLTLTGNDAIFAARMAKLADEMGITVLNPELQIVITEHREARILQIKEAAIKVQKQPESTTPNTKEHAKEDQSIQEAPTVQQPTNEVEIPEEKVKTPQERLREIVRSIDPNATFVVVDPMNSPYPYHGPVAATLDDDQESQDIATGFAQHTGRSVYALHPNNAPRNHADENIEVKYRAGKQTITIPDLNKGKGHGE